MLKKEEAVIETEELYHTYRPLLFSLAYRMLGTVMDAEDLVQETFVAYAGIEAAEAIANERAYLCKMLTNRCVDFLRSARHRRELYVGPWLPEPIIYREDRDGRDGRTDHDPLRELLSRDDLTMAYLTMMETLSPTERAVFVLREAYQYDYAEIAELVGKGEANCRKIYSRVKTKLGPDLADRRVEYARDQDVLNRFLTAFAAGDTQALLALLTDDATLLSDGGGKISAATRPVVSAAHILAFLQGIARKSTPDTTVEIVTINGQPGLLFWTDGTLTGTFSFERRGDQIQTIYMVRNPEKLTGVSKKRP